MKHIKTVNEFLNEENEPWKNISRSNREFTFDEIIKISKYQDDVDAVKNFLCPSIVEHGWGDEIRKPNRDQIDVWSFTPEEDGLKIIYDVNGCPYNELNDSYEITLTKEELGL